MFIELSKKFGNSIYINPKDIVYLETIEEGLTRVTLNTEGLKSIVVKETVEEIYNKIARYNNPLMHI